MKNSFKYETYPILSFIHWAATDQEGIYREGNTIKFTGKISVFYFLINDFFTGKFNAKTARENTDHFFYPVCHRPLFGNK